MRRPPPATDVERRDPAIPGLAALLDPAGARAAVAALTGRAPVGAPIVEYARYKPGVSALVLWRAALEDGEVLRVYAKAYAAGRDAEDAAKAARRLRAGESVPFARLEAPNSIAFRFPFDAGLPSLRRLLRADGPKRVLSRARPDRVENGWRAKGRGSSLEIVRYKPENRFVFRLSASWKRDADGRREREGSFGRLLPPKSARRAAEVHSAVGEAKGPGFPRLPGLLGFDPDTSCVLLETLEGTPLLGAALEAFEETGRALAALHRSRLALPEADSAARRVERLAREFASFERLAEPWAESALALLGAIRPRLGGGSAPVHGDFHAEQVLVGEEGPAFVDLDACGLGDPALDLGSFLAHLRLLVRSGDLAEGAAADRARAFLQGYGKGEEELGPATALAFLDLGLSPLRRLEASGSARVAAAVEEASALLAPPSLLRAAIRKDGGLEYEFLRSTPVGPRPHWEIVSGGGEKTRFEEPGAAGPESLRAALDPERLGEILQPHLPGADVERIEILGLRPGRRGALRAFLRGGRSLIVKAYAKGRVPPAVPVLPDGPFPPRLARRVGEAPELGLVFLEDLSGESLLDRLPRGEAESDLRATARALRAFHAGKAPEKRRTFSDELENAARRHEVASRHGAPGEEARAEAIARLRRARVPAAPLACVHGDFYEKQVLVSEAEVAFLDLDLLAGGDPALDLGNFLAHLALLEARGGLGRNRAGRLGEALLEAYGDGGPDFGDRVDLFRAVSLVRLSALRAIRPGEEALVHELLRRCREVLCSVTG